MTKLTIIKPYGEHKPGDRVNIRNGTPLLESGHAYYGWGPTPAGITIDAEPEQRFESMTVAELREELERRGLPQSGNKVTLIARLRGE